MGVAFRNCDTLKEARAAAREEAGFYILPIYKDPDGTYSVAYPGHKRSEFVCGIDQAGRRYKRITTRNICGEKVRKYIPILSNKERNKKHD